MAALASRHAQAQDSIELGWHAPPGCPQEAEVRERVRALRGQTQGAGRLRAEGRIERLDGRYRLTLTVRDGDAVRERTLEADSCGDLAGAAAVALGLLIRDERAGAGSGESVSGTGAAGARGSDSSSSGNDAGGSADVNRADSSRAAKGGAAAARSKQPAKAPDTDKSGERSSSKADASGAAERRWRILVRAPIGVLALGRLPKPSGGVGAAVGFAYDAWRVAVTGRIFGKQTVHSNNAYETGARVGRKELELGVCRDWRDGRLALAPCLSAAIQWEDARGSGPGVTPQPASAKAVLLAGGAEAQLFIFEPLALVAGVALGVETSQPNLQVTSAGDVKKLGPVEASFSIGSQWIF